MNKSTSDALRALAKGDDSRSETARLRDVIDDVEAALEAGVSRTAILETLHQQGFKMSLKSFESALYRIRKRRAAAGKVAQPKTAVTPAAAKPQSSATSAASTSVEAPKNEGTDKFVERQSNPLTHKATSPVPKATERKPGPFSHDPNSGNDRDDLI
ncbi:hypothetical protein ACT43E_20780 (plasmid) [Acinetobacter baumannii]